MPALEQTVEIVNRLGLHARASAKMVTLASKFTSNVHAKKDGREVSAKSIMGLMMLAAAKGSFITVMADGDDAEQAVAALVQLIAERFGEDA